MIEKGQDDWRYFTKSNIRLDSDCKMSKTRCVGCMLHVQPLSREDKPCARLHMLCYLYRRTASCYFSCCRGHKLTTLSSGEPYGLQPEALVVTASNQLTFWVWLQSTFFYQFLHEKITKNSSLGIPSLKSNCYSSWKHNASAYFIASLTIKFVWAV